MTEHSDEMIYEAREDKNPGIALFQLVVLWLVTLPVLVALILAALGFGWFALIGGVITAFVAYRVWRRTDGPRKITLRVRGKTLSVIDGRRTFEIALSKLDEVTLDKKEVKKLREGTPILPELMMVNSTVGEVSEIVRVVLQGDGTAFRLSEEYQPYSTGLEGMGKVRVFLRKHGWVPPSERWGDAGDAGNASATKKKPKRAKADG